MACRKRAYPSERKADRALASHWRKPRPGKMPVRYYPCPGCGKWHLTSEPKRA